MNWHEQYPIGMGTGAVYVTLAGLKQHPGHPLTVVETVFYFLNMALFLLNTTTLLLQFASTWIGLPRWNVVSLITPVYPRQAKRLITDPTKGIFVPLIVRSLLPCPRLSCILSAACQVLSFATIIIGTINYGVPSGHVTPNFIYALFW